MADEPSLVAFVRQVIVERDTGRDIMCRVCSGIWAYQTTPSHMPWCEAPRWLEEIARRLAVAISDPIPGATGGETGGGAPDYNPLSTTHLKIRYGLPDRRHEQQPVLDDLHALTVQLLILDERHPGISSWRHSLSMVVGGISEFRGELS